MNDVICLSIDAESDAGSVLAKKFGVRGYPTLLFLNSDATPRDAIRGYMPVDPFHAEVKRIKSGEGTIAQLSRAVEANPESLEQRFKLIEKLMNFNATESIGQHKEALARLVKAEKGFQARDVNARWELSEKLKQAGMADLAKAQLDAIRKLDPEGKSLPMRRLAFAEIASSISGVADLHRVESFLVDETYTEVLFDGWYLIYTRNNREAKSSRDPEQGAKPRSEARRAAKELWKHTPEKYLARLGNQIAWGFYEASAELTPEEKQWALEVAEIAMKASDGDVNVIDTFACCLFINGRTEEAIQHIERCIELDPANKTWSERRDEFRKTQG